MIQILPSILAKDRTNFNTLITAAEPYFNSAQVDFMDGIFVPNRSLQPKDLTGLQTKLDLEAHLMVQNPLLWAPQLKDLGFKRVIVHAELGGLLPAILAEIRNTGLEAGIAVDPHTDINATEHHWRQVGLIQLMGVNPGHYGAQFQPDVLAKIRFLKEKRYQGVIQVDGAVTPPMAPLLVRSGATSLVVGSYFFGSEASPSYDKIGEKLNLLRAALGEYSS